MDWKRFNYCFFLILTFVMVSFLSEEAEAQGPGPSVPVMGVYYPSRYRIRGLIEFRYNDYSTKLTRAGTTVDTDRKTFEQRYRLGLEGYIYDRRLAVFSTYVTLYNRAITQDIGKDKYNEINYNFSLTVLPLRPISLDLYGSRTTGTFKSIDIPAYDTTSNNYGLRLYLNLRKLPNITVSYDYWDYDSERFPGKRTTNRYGIDIGGSLDFIRTTYVLRYELSDYSGPDRTLSYKYLNAETRTLISKKGDVFHTGFQYDDLELTKVLKFGAQLLLSPYRPFTQGYSYLFLHYDTGQAKTDYHDVRGSWGYRFSDSLISHAGAGYSISKSDGVSDNSYDLDLGLNYNRPLKGFDFHSYYRLSYINRGRISGTFIGNSLGLGLSSRNIKLGRVYAEYNLTYDIQDKGNFTEHRLRAGIEGKGPGRGFWNLEGQYVNSTNELGGTNIALGYGVGPSAVNAMPSTKAQYYTLTARLGYPLGRKGMVTLEGDYTTGSLDSRGFNSYYYEARANYRIFNNLSLLAWWREEWDNIGGGAFNRKTRYYDLQLNYRLRRLFFTIDYVRVRTVEGPVSTEIQNIYMRLTRPI